MLFNQLLDMPQLSSGWIILAQEKCSLTCFFYIIFEGNKICVYD
jgi:hypothetical protein